MTDHPQLLHTVIDAVDCRALAEFYRQLLDLVYRPGDEPPAEGADDADWLVLATSDGTRAIAVQQVADQPRTTWPEPGVAAMFHLDTAVPDVATLDRVHDLALSLGAELRFDRTDDPEEPLRAYADPEGHLFCVLVAPPG